jgi:3-phenylpropionate/trans-cinnamate dioxygenase ferredoxin reductase subunit
MEEAEPQPTYLLDEGMMASLEVNFLRGNAATAIDRKAKTVVLADGKKIPYDRLLIATGAEPRRLSQAGAERALLLRDLADSIRIRSEFISGKGVAIIGGGFIGLELAASAAKRGCRVTVIEAQPRVLMRGVPPEIARRIAARHAEAGVAILTSASIAHISADTIVLSDGREIAAEVIIAGIGAAPRIKLAEQAGLALDNGIACNTYLQTSDPHIFAVGDCCSFPHPIFGACASRPGAMPATRRVWPLKTCSAGKGPMKRCRGSGRTNTNSTCRSQACHSGEFPLSSVCRRKAP